MTVPSLRWHSHTGILTVLLRLFSRIPAETCHYPVFHGTVPGISAAIPLVPARIPPYLKSLLLHILPYIILCYKCANLNGCTKTKNILFAGDLLLAPSLLSILSVPHSLFYHIFLRISNAVTLVCQQRHIDIWLLGKYYVLTYLQKLEEEFIVWI